MKHKKHFTDLSHNDLVFLAGKWLKGIGCRIVIKELVSASRETPDAIGWRSGLSFVVECKTSQSDFKKDQKKFFRYYPEYGMGNWRFYFCKTGLIKPCQLIGSKWGLIYTDGKKFNRVICPKGNTNWCSNIPFKADLKSENTILLSALSRKREVFLNKII